MSSKTSSFELLLAALKARSDIRTNSMSPESEFFIASRNMRGQAVRLRGLIDLIGHKKLSDADKALVSYCYVVLHDAGDLIASHHLTKQDDTFLSNQVREVCLDDEPPADGAGIYSGPGGTNGMDTVE